MVNMGGLIQLTEEYIGCEDYLNKNSYDRDQLAFQTE